MKSGPRKGKRGVDLISDVLPFGRLWYTKPDDAIGYATFYSRSHHSVIRVYDAAGNVIETHEHNLPSVPAAPVCIRPELRPARSCICPSPLCRKRASVRHGKRLPPC